jgi:hypothetical protein
MPMPYQRVSCWLAVTVIWMIFLGTGSFMAANLIAEGTLRFFESGASLQTENLWVKCDACGVSKQLAKAFGKSGRDNLPACRGRHPHLDKFDSECNEQPRAVLLGATNSWFPITLSVLAIPLEKNQLSQLILDGWDYFSDAESVDESKGASLRP